MTEKIPVTVRNKLEIRTPVIIVLCAWHYRVCARTGRPDVSVLRLGVTGRLISNFFRSVAAHSVEQIRLVETLYTTLGR